ncbi:U-actitoxin-Avd3g-like isoform X1 [Hypanus sabinus]|uniref:U-actitoxin-Avd3g-like isoform X1 n=1 Tax=Hypanus sabinus TaxID=79690 RepID=UPI0028C39ADE|nr:U-actitoxin-Avd3g-like isoform X1 [Hypanus sabinus]
MKWGIVVLISCILLLSLPCSAEGKANCSDPKEIGLCKHSFPYYYYNTKTRKCERFMYSGCGGNGNRFMQKNDCIIQCELRANNCSDPKKIGSCENYSPYYYYNTKTRKCERFMYSGCGGNGNKYIMLSECIVQCELKSKAK